MVVTAGGGSRTTGMFTIEADGRHYRQFSAISNRQSDRRRDFMVVSLGGADAMELVVVPITFYHRFYRGNGWKESEARSKMCDTETGLGGGRRGETRNEK